MTLGVVIGRFQVDELHTGHRALIKYVQDHCDELLILVGWNEATEFRPNKSNPLSIKLRMDMVKKMYPNASVSSIKDHRDDRRWSELVDSTIKQCQEANNIQEYPVIIFGGRDSFLPHYQGQFPVWELPEEWRNGFYSEYSATKIRESLLVTPKNSTTQFRRGLIHSVGNLPPAVFPVVDIATIALDKARNRWMIVVGQREGEDYWRLPGGFVDVQDSSLEAAALRELREETGISDDTYAVAIKYIGSSVIDDWRFKDRDKVLTSLFLLEVPFNTVAKAADDLHEVSWMPLFWALETYDYKIAPEHLVLVKNIRNYVKQHYGDGQCSVII